MAGGGRGAWWTGLGILAGAALGFTLHYYAHCSDLTIELIGYPGELYLRALQQLSLPLIVTSLVTGVSRLRRAQARATRIAWWSLAYYLLSMLLAVLLGTSLVYLVKPGRGGPLDGFVAQPGDDYTNTLEQFSVSKDDAWTTIDPLLDIGRDLIPENLIQAAADANYLGVVACATLCAFVLCSFGDRANYLVQLIRLLNDVILKIVGGVIALTPIGVCSLTANAILTTCDISRLLDTLGLYTLTVLAGLLIHGLIVLPATTFILCRRNPFEQFRDFLPALVMALGTSSSIATMPVTMECAEASGCEPGLVQFVVPFGTIINRDGSALYEAVSILFICQAHSIELSLSNILALALAVTIVSLGFSSLSNSLLGPTVALLQVLGLPQYARDASVLYALDWVLKALRTSVNVWGDACACSILDVWATRSKHVSSDYDLQELLLL